MNDSEKGATYVEASLVIPFLLILTMSSVDLGRALTEYISLYATASEAIKVGARQVYLQEETIYTGEQTPCSSLINNIGNCPVTTHNSMHRRAELMFNLFKQQSDSGVKFSETKFESEFQRSPNLISFKVESKFKPLFFGVFMRNIPMSATAYGPYLLAN